MKLELKLLCQLRSKAYKLVLLYASGIDVRCIISIGAQCSSLGGVERLTAPSRLLLQQLFLFGFYP